MNEPIISMLRQRPPFLFVDSCRSLDMPGHVEASFRFTGLEDYFAGHFPAEPVVPGVLLIEAMAQAARLALVHRFGRPLHGYLSNVERVRFNKPVRPPTEVRMIAKLIMSGEVGPGDFATANCAVFVDKARAARADITLSIHHL